MSQHRRSAHRRKIAVVAAVAVTLGAPTAAIACEKWPGTPTAEAATGRHHGHWHHHKHHTTPTPSPTSSATATPSPTPTPTATATSAPTGDTGRVLTLVNTERKKAGCAALTVNAKLTSAAQLHSQDMAAHRTMSHTGSDGSSPGDRIKAAGYNARSWGENVAYGYNSADAVMTAWMNSPGHRANILDCSFKEIGIGLAQPGWYWTQDFGSSS